MWIFWALVAMMGSTIWYLAPRFFPTQNPLSPLIVWGALSVLILPFLSKLLYKTWFDPSSIPTGFFLSFSTLATVGLILALNTGGKIGPVAVIVELSLIVATLVSFIVFREHLNWIQILGIILAIIGVCLVVFFEK